MIIALSGVDGSGKSTVGKEVATHFKKKKYKVKNVYLGEYFLVKYIVRFLHAVVGKKAKTTKNGSDINPFLSMEEKPFYLKLWVPIAIFDNYLRQLQLISFQLRGYVVVCDRHFYDKLVGFELHGYTNAFFSTLYLHLMPMPTHFVVLDISPKLSIERETNGNHTLSFYKKLRKLYFSKLPANATVIKVDKLSIDEVVGQVLGLIEN